jgi:hypothetical protein
MKTPKIENFATGTIHRNPFLPVLKCYSQLGSCNEFLRIQPALVMMKIAQTHALKQIPSEPDLAFCFTMLQRVFRSFAFVIQQLGPDLRNIERARVEFYGLSAMSGLISTAYRETKNALKRAVSKEYFCLPRREDRSWSGTNLSGASTTCMHILFGTSDHSKQGRIRV